MGLTELLHYRHPRQLDNYRIPLPGAISESGRLKANVAFPGLTIRYTTEGSEPAADSPIYGGPVAAAGTVKLRAFDGRDRGSRTSVVMF